MAVAATEGTAGLFHIDRNGNPAKCEASKEICPLGGGGHFSTADEARESFEDANDPFDDHSPVPTPDGEVTLSVPFKQGVTKFNHCAVIRGTNDSGEPFSIVMELDQQIDHDELDTYSADLSDAGGALWEAAGGDMTEWEEKDMHERIEWLSPKLSLHNGVTFHNKNGKFGYETEDGIQKKGFKPEEFRVATFGV